MRKYTGRKLKRRNRWADVLAALILLGALVIAGFTLRDYMYSKSLNFYNVQEGSIAVTLPGEMLVLRHEYVLLAPVAGEFKPVAAEGERVKEGGIVGYCANVAVTAAKGGAVSYLLDGWEEKLQINTFGQLDWEQVFTLLQEEEAAISAAAAAAAEKEEEELAVLNISANRPVARLVDNLLDYTVVLKVKDTRHLLAEATRITFNLPNGKMFNNSFYENWRTPDGTVYFFFNISSKEDTLFSLRYSQAEIIAKEVKGIIIPSTAVFVNEEGKVGVYIQKKRKLVFAEIEELTSKDGFSVVNGLDRTAVVVSNPAKVVEGQRIYKK